MIMNNYSTIINNVTNQIAYWHVRGFEVSRIILGREIVSILKASNYYWCYTTSDEDMKFMGLPVTIDYENKWIMMACVGNEWDGRNFLST